MNTRMIAGLAVLSVMISGCATSNQPVATDDVSTLSMTQRYQAAVNSQARRNGAEVHWVNVPDESDLAQYKDSGTGEGSNGSN